MGPKTSSPNAGPWYSGGWQNSFVCVDTDSHKQNRLQKIDMNTVK